MILRRLIDHEAVPPPGKSIHSAETTDLVRARVEGGRRETARGLSITRYQQHLPIRVARERSRRLQHIVDQSMS